MGDCYAAAVVEVLSKKDLDQMDKENELEEERRAKEDLEKAAMEEKKMKTNWSTLTKVSLIFAIVTVLKTKIGPIVGGFGGLQ